MENVSSTSLITVQEAKEIINNIKEISSTINQAADSSKKQVYLSETLNKSVDLFKL